MSMRKARNKRTAELSNAKQMNLSEQSVVTVAKDQVSCGLGAESAILNMKDGIYYGLDPIGTHVWKLLQTPRKIADIREVLLQEYDVEPERCRRDLVALLEDLLRAGLIEVR
jgi:coenzyme PQQ synthesis protein D (PqqD)